MRLARSPARLYSGFARSEYLNLFIRQKQNARICSGLADGKIAGQVSKSLPGREVEFVNKRLGRVFRSDRCGSSRTRRTAPGQQERDKRQGWQHQTAGFVDREHPDLSFSWSLAQKNDAHPSELDRCYHMIN